MKLCCFFYNLSCPMKFTFSQKMSVSIQKSKQTCDGSKYDDFTIKIFWLSKIYPKILTKFLINVIIYRKSNSKVFFLIVFNCLEFNKNFMIMFCLKNIRSTQQQCKTSKVGITTLLRQME